jgi:ribonuclease-3
VTLLTELADQLEPELGQQVFTHTSWALERTLSYERLEFLGDSVLSLCISTEICRRYPDYNEGDLAKVRAYVVSRNTCAKVSSDMGLDRRLYEEAKKSDAPNIDSLARNANVMAAVIEALIGALYLQMGFEKIIAAVIDAFAEHIAFAASEYVDYKTVLQEEVAKAGQEISYEVVMAEGPPHERTFTSEVVLDGKVLGSGQGRTKKVSQQEAAKEALDVLRARREDTS